jgi:hypothetical protein
MTKLRAGDTVIFKAKVLSTAPHGDSQQIMAKILPNGEEIGWCLMNENAFYPDQLALKVGDKVMHRTDDANTYEIMAFFDDGQVAIRQVGLKTVQMSHVNRIRRFS